jgi:hypothetical protein
MGARVDLAAIGEASGDPRTALFGEAPGGAVVAGPAEVVGGLAGARMLGTVGGDRLQIDGLADLEVTTLRERFEGAIPAAFA